MKMEVGSAPRLDEATTYWQRRLAGGLTESAICRDFRRPIPFRFEPGRIEFALSAAHSRRLPGWTDDDPQALYAFFVAVVHVLLARYSGETRIVTGTPRLEGGGVVPIVTDIDRDLSFAEHLHAVGEAIGEAHRFESISFDELLEAAAVPPSEDHCPLFSILVRLEDLHPEVGIEQLKCDMVLRFGRDAEQVRGAIEFNVELFRAGNVEPLPLWLRRIAGAVIDSPEQTVDRVPLLDARERNRLLHSVGRGPRLDNFPVDRTFSELFEAQVDAAPETVAASHGDRRLTYAELERDANRLAYTLRAQGVERGDLVGVLVPRGLEFLTAIVAIWKAGGAYIPIDPSYPEDRIAYMIEDSAARVVLVLESSLARLGRHLAQAGRLERIVCLGDSGADDGEAKLDGHLSVIRPRSWLEARAERLPPLAGSRDPAYMMYTSGSTGRPKGAIIRHDGAINHIFAQVEALGLDGVRRFVQSAPSSSDISVWQFAAPVVLGGQTIIIDDATDVETLFSATKRERASIIEIVPIVLKYLIEFADDLAADERDLPHLQWMMVTGESAPVELVNRWLETYPDIPVVNSYGPTEAADDITQAVIRTPLPRNQLSVSIGQPLANLDIYLLDRRLELVPDGMPGEICVSGIGVGEGYWGQPERTRQSFVRNPIRDGLGPVVYRTGDLGRWTTGGNLEFLGRMDQQVQVRGFRIELEEIEAVMRRCAGVLQAVVAVQGRGEGDGYLVGFVVPEEGATVDLDALREQIADRLAEYMVPAVLATLESVPLTPSGKIDRRSLPVIPRGEVRGRRSGRPPATATERALAEIWEGVLEVRPIGADESFFDLGGDSIGAAEIVVAARRIGIHLAPQAIFDHPTIAELAERLDVGDADRETPEQAPRARPAREDAERAVESLSERETGILHAAYDGFVDAYPLSPCQQGVLLDCLMSKARDIYLDQFCYRLEGPLESRALRDAWRAAVARIPILRTAFVHRRLRRPVQLVRERVDVPWAYLDWSTLQEKERGRRLAEFLEDDVHTPFVLTEPPLMRLTLIRLGEQLHELVWTHHHLLLDGWSLGLVWDEVLASYAELSTGQPQPRYERPPYRDYIGWLEGRGLEEPRHYWERALEGFAGGARVPHRPAPHRPPMHGSIDFCLSRYLTGKVTQFARERRLTLATVLHGAWAQLLWHRTGADDLAFGTVVSGRQADLPGIDRIIGMMVNTLPLRVRKPDDAGDAGWLSDLQRDLLALQAQGYVPLGRVNQWSGLPRRQLPFFDTVFVMLNYPEEPVTPPGLPAPRVRPAHFRTVPDAALTVLCRPGDELFVRLVYDEQAFSREHADKLAREFRARIAELVGAPVPTRQEGDRRSAATGTAR